MHRLENLRCYLAGPIDHAADDGVVWRNDMTKWLENRKVKVLDPCDKPIKNVYYKEIEGEKIKMFELKQTGRYFELTQRMKEIVHMDLRMVDVSDFVIVYLDTLQILVFISVFYDFPNLHKEKFLYIKNISF